MPAAEAAIVVNNCAAALALVATALGQDRELVIARGELVEIGDGFRIPRAAGRHRRPAARGRDDEPGHRSTTTATPLHDATGAVLKVHPSNFVVRGFTRSVPGARAGRRARPAAACRWSPTSAPACSAPHPLLPDEPDLQSTLAAGADLVLASGDKLLGGPQAGLVLGRAELVARLRRHPLYRALRVDKTTLAALEATLRGPLPPVQADARRRRSDPLRARAGALAARLRRRRGRRGRRRHRGPGRRGRGAGAPAAQRRGLAAAGASPSRCAAASRRSSATSTTAARCSTCAASRPVDDDALAAAVLEVPARDEPGMDVIATAGHVDHGKSALVRALTGMEPDRWEEERRRGLTIDLGFAWTTLPSGRRLAVVDVPGHERFVGNMLAGVGSVPAALVVVAADDGWSAQTAEHVAVLDALGVRHALLAVTKADLADPGPVLADVAGAAGDDVDGRGARGGGQRA